MFYIHFESAQIQRQISNYVTLSRSMATHAPHCVRGSAGEGLRRCAAGFFATLRMTFSVSQRRVYAMPMNELIIRHVLPKDLDECFLVETSGFPPEEAATKETIKLRLETFHQGFLVAEIN